MTSTRDPLPPEPTQLEDLPNELQRKIILDAYNRDPAKERFNETIRHIQLNNNLRQMAQNNLDYYSNLALTSPVGSPIEQGARALVQGYNQEVGRFTNIINELNESNREDARLRRFYRGHIRGLERQLRTNET